jgi:hypothetical protein
MTKGQPVKFDVPEIWGSIVSRFRDTVQWHNEALCAVFLQ